MLKLTKEQILDFWFVDVQEGTIRKKVQTRNRIKPGKILGTLRYDGYLVIKKCINSEPHQWLNHRLIWIAAGNDWVINRKLHIHHLNEIKTDNRISNLELIAVRDHVNHHTDRDNDMRNIYWHQYKQKWAILFGISGERKFFGYYDDLIEAKLIRDQIIAQLIEKGLY